LTTTAALVVNDGHDLEQALKRAAREHGINLQHARPSREALHTAIHEYRTLFRPQQEQQLKAQRCIAAEAMQTFSRFGPRLIGPLVRGDGPLDKVQLLLTADTPEQVMLALNDQRIPWRESEVVLHYAGGRRAAKPALQFIAGDSRVELILLDDSGRSDPPRDPMTGGRLEALSPGQLATLLAGTAD
jgi:hypothetical protein